MSVRERKYAHARWFAASPGRSTLSRALALVIVSNLAYVCELEAICEVGGGNSRESEEKRRRKALDGPPLVTARGSC